MQIPSAKNGPGVERDRQRNASETFVGDPVRRMRRNVDSPAGLEAEHISLFGHVLNVPMASNVVALEFSLAFSHSGELTYVHLLDAMDLEQKVVLSFECPFSI